MPKGWQVDSDPRPIQSVPASCGEPVQVPDTKADRLAVFRVYAQPGEVVRPPVGERRTAGVKIKVQKSCAEANSGSR